MNKKLLVAALLIAGSATQAFAATTTYATRGAFNGAVGAHVVEDFQGCGSATVGLPANFALSSGNLGPCSSIAPGITFAPSAGFDLYIAGPGQSANPTTALGVNWPPAGTNTISFSAGSNIFAADLFQNFGGGAQSGNPVDFSISAYGAGNVLLGTFLTSVASGTGGFFGLTSTDLITKVTVNQVGSGFAVIDNVAFDGNVNPAVPEPASWAMMIGGFALAGGALRSRKSRLALA